MRDILLSLLILTIFIGYLHAAATTEETVCTTTEADVTSASLEVQYGDLHNVSAAIRQTRASCIANVFTNFDRMVGCVGGTGGYQILYTRKLGYVVRRLEVWKGCGAPNDGFKGIRVTYDDPSLNPPIFGNTCGSGSSFTFEQGEYLVGDVTFSGNGMGTRVGYMRFSTSRGREFKFGNDGRDKYNYASNNGFLTGIHGSANADLDMLGFIVTYGVQRTAIENVVYPGLGSIQSGLDPKGLFSGSATNDSPLADTVSRSVTETKGEQKCWSNTFTASFGMSATVTAGVPLVAEVTAGYQWEVSASTTQSQCVDTSRAETVAHEFAIPAYHVCELLVTQFASQIDLEYTGTFVFYMVTGNRVTTSTRGWYDGMYISSASSSKICTALRPQAEGVKDEL